MYFWLIKTSIAQERVSPGVDLPINETLATEGSVSLDSTPQSEIKTNEEQLSEGIFRDETSETDLIKGNSQASRNGNCHESNIVKKTRMSMYLRILQLIGLAYRCKVICCKVM